MAEWLEKGDNVQLAMNIFNWLAGKEIEKLNRGEIKKILIPIWINYNIVVVKYYGDVLYK